MRQIHGWAIEELTAAITTGTAGTDADQQDVSDWWEVLADYIETEEDTELAQMQLQKITGYVQTYSVAMQNKLNIFNDANVEYQAAIQRNLEQAKIDMTDDQKEAD